MRCPQRVTQIWVCTINDVLCIGFKKILQPLVEILAKLPSLDNLRIDPVLAVLNLSGAKSVAAHMFAFNGRDDSLFRGAILQSGAPVTGIYWPATSDYSQTAYDLVVSRTGCLSASEQLSCLRSLDFTALFNAMKCTSDFTLPFYLPSIDGGIIAESPSKQIGKGQYVKVPTLQGQNNDEGALFTAWVQSNSDAETRGFFSSTQFVLLH